MKRARGTGSVFKRGQVWWYSFVRDGMLVRESSQSTLKTTAQSKLNDAIRETEGGFQNSKVSVADLMKTALAEYERKGRKSLQDAKERWAKHLEPAFGTMSAKRVTTELLEKYAKARVDSGAAKATVNRELALLRFAFNLARKRRKLQFVVWFPMFKENNTRTGFLADADYDKLAAACSKRGLWLRAMFETGFQFGWRSGELVGMRVRQFDKATGTLRLEPQTTKNDEGREAVMPPDLLTLIHRCATGKKPDDLLFTRDRQQRTVKDFRGAWDGARRDAGLPDLLFHDLRRSAVRNMIRRGIPQHIAMKISGHKTDSVFRRYAIVAQSDLQEAAAKMARPISQVTIDPHHESQSGSQRPN